MEATDKKPTSNEIDLVFICDCTGSMGSFISAAQQSISSIIEKIQAAETRDVRFALISFRDHPPQDSSYITQIYPFTTSVKTAKANVSQMSASGGGDAPEAVGSAIHDALHLDYRKAATKIVVLVADAPPHGLGKHSSGDGFPEGDPTGNDLMADVWKMYEEGIIVYSVGCSIIVNSPFAREFYQAVSKVTGGRYVSLNNAEILAGIIVGGAEEEVGLEKIGEEVETERKKVEEEMREKGEKVEEEEVCGRVWERLQTKGVKIDTLQVDETEADKMENKEVVEKLAKCKTLAEVRSVLNSETAPARTYVSAGGYGFGSRSRMASHAPSSISASSASSGGYAAQRCTNTSTLVSRDQVSRLAWRNQAKYK
eukprot:TRINITY_DN14523_c0_g1_i1.p1 TRINITY_DN14523_c0_g1~~TRINITY_DN14523_c0_g1_i1.p1  ORF type:complete len:369 (+),score=90.66 TRINITY_DN14523_c0_g1_i1:102-1208(+)